MQVLQRHLPSNTGNLVSAIVDEMLAKEDGSLPQEKIHFYSAVSYACCIPCTQSALAQSV